MGKRMMSQPVFMVPKKKRWERCSFRKGCVRECLPPDLADFNEIMKKRLSGQISYLLRKIRQGKKEFWKARNEYADELTLFLQGSAIPGGKEGGGKYCACGTAVPVLGLKLMQNFSLDEMREATRGMDLALPLHGAYSSSASPQPNGLNSHFAMLLARIAAIELDWKPDTLRVLEVEGGLGGARAVSRIATEPTTPFYIRNAFLDSLAAVANCVDFGADTPQILDREIALSISRFSTMEIVFAESECGMIPAAHTGKNAPRMPSEPDMGRIRQMSVAYFGEIFQAMVNFAGRIDSFMNFGTEDEYVRNPTLAEFYFNLRKTIIMIAGRENSNIPLAIGMCERKEGQIYGLGATREEKRGIAIENMDTAEQAIAKGAIAKLLEEGELDGECAGKLMSVLADNEGYPEEKIVELQRIAANVQLGSEAHN